MNDKFLEKALKELAEFEKFKNELNRESDELSEESLMMVSAAGESGMDYRFFMELMKK